MSGAGGIATFSGLSVSAPGFGYTLVASASGFTGATSTAFDVAPAGASLSFLVQPATRWLDRLFRQASKCVLPMAWDAASLG